MDKNIKPAISINPSELSRKGEEIYQNELKGKLEKEHIGKFVAIEVESKDYFLADSPVEANQKAKNKYPNKVFYMIKIGFPAVYTMSHHFKSSSYGSLF